jgi:hypothetical protein
MEPVPVEKAGFVSSAALVTVLRRNWLAIKRWRWPLLVIAVLLGLAVFVWSSGGSPDRSAEQSFMSRAEVRPQGAVTVRAAVLTDDESQLYFGASLADHGIQAIWLEVDNASDSLLQFLPIVTDPNYFSESEVEQLLSAWWRGGANASIKAAVAQAPLPDVIAQKQTAAGFVFTHREGGLKLFNVGFETGHEELLFRFALPICGMSYAVQRVDFGSIYALGRVSFAANTSTRRSAHYMYSAGSRTSRCRRPATT